MDKIVGGGPKKVLYTLNAVRKIGLKNSAKALNAKNTCKACGLGMGGQQGGMTNELGEFPSVCNKSVQAQSTDIQAPIPSEVFRHSIEELRELSAKELEHAGRLGKPIFKGTDAASFKEVTWDWAFNHAIKRFSESSPDKSFFYASGRSSNEAGFLLQLFARLYGTNNVTNCSYYCHQATSVGLGSTIGTGTSTIELEDLGNCDLVFIFGANPASNHPRFIHQLKNCRDRGGKVIVVNPAKEPGLVKFSVPKSPASMLIGGTEIASHYLQPNLGSDIALIKGISKTLIEKGLIEKQFLKQSCKNADIYIKDINNTSWHDIEAASGIPKKDIENVGRVYGASKNTVFAWGMGITHHQFGSENVEYIANLALLRGMVGKQYAGLLPLRGHSNVQGIGTIGVKPVLSEEVLKATEDHLAVNFPQKKGLDTLAALSRAHDGAIDSACMVGGNLYAATPDSRWANDALNQIGFKLYLTTTLNQGHLYGIENEVLILPVCSRDEEKQPTTQESMFNFVRLSDGGITRLDNIFSEVEIIAKLGQGLYDAKQSRESLKKFSFKAFGDHEKIRETIARTIPGMNQLKDIGIAKKEFHVKHRILHKPNFFTEDQKAHFQIHAIPKSRHEDFPFLLASIRSEGQFNSIIYEEHDSYRYNAKRNDVLISPEDLKALSLKSGDRITLRSRNGELKGLRVKEFDLRPGNILAYYPEANVLSERKVDPRSFTPNFKSIPVNIEIEK